MRRQHWGLVHLTVIFVFLVSFTIFLICHNQASLATDHSDIPQLNISLTGITLEEIKSGNKETKYPGNTINLTANGHTQTFTDVELKGRGNSTWLPEKKPYQVKFFEKVNLFGMGEAKKWILLANSFDPSNIRNDTAFYLEQMLGEKYALSGKYIELYFNNNYEGLYYLVPKVEIGTTRINLTNPLGILVELENLHSIEEICYISALNSCITIRDTVNNSHQKMAIQDFMSAFNTLELAAKNNDYSTVIELIDVESFAKYYLLSEFTVNPDAYLSSFFMYKDGPNDKIHAGPGWDFDLAFGNREWMAPHDTSFYSPYTTQIMKNYSIQTYCDTKTDYSKLFYNLTKTKEFSQLIKDTYKVTMLGKKSTLINHLKNTLTAIKNPAAYKNANFQEESNTVLDWVSKRYDYFDDIYGDLQNITTNRRTL